MRWSSPAAVVGPVLTDTGNNLLTLTNPTLSMRVRVSRNEFILQSTHFWQKLILRIKNHL